MKLISQSQIIIRKELIISIDIAKYEQSTFILDTSASESLCNPFLFKNNKEGFHKLYDELNKYAKDDLLISMEDTEHYNFTIESSLLTESYKHPVTTKNLRKAILKSVKVIRKMLC